MNIYSRAIESYTCMRLKSTDHKNQLLWSFVLKRETCAYTVQNCSTKKKTVFCERIFCQDDNNRKSISNCLTHWFNSWGTSNLNRWNTLLQPRSNHNSSSAIEVQNHHFYKYRTDKLTTSQLQTWFEETMYQRDVNALQDGNTNGRRAFRVSHFILNGYWGSGPISYHEIWYLWEVFSITCIFITVWTDKAILFTYFVQSNLINCCVPGRFF